MRLQTQTEKFKQYITGQNLFNGVLITIGVIISSLILFKRGALLGAFALPIGYIFTLQSDVAGPIEIRRKNLLYVIPTYIAIIIITGISRHIQGLIFIELVVFGFGFSMLTIYGNRGQTVGTLALITFSFNIDDHFTGPHYIQGSLLFLAGSLLYVIIFFLIDKVRPYFLLQQLLGENLIAIGKYLAEKRNLYRTNPNYEKIYQELMAIQVNIKAEQDVLRESIFETRKLTKESTAKSRALMATFIDSVRLFERIMTTHQNYEEMHQFKHKDVILKKFGSTIEKIAEVIQKIGVSMQAGIVDAHDYDLETDFQDCKKTYTAVRNKVLNADNINDFFALKQVLYSIHDIIERIDRIQALSQISLGKKLNNGTIIEKVSTDIINRKKSDAIQQFKNNLSLKSSAFRHSLRVCIAMILGYCAALTLSVGHGYWILMTIVIILKPAYSISKQRNWYRLFGTITGLVVGYAIITYIPNPIVHFIILVVAMAFGYSMLKINYMLATFGITLYIIISFYFLAPSHFSIVIEDRLIDTAIATVICFVVMATVFPVWEKQNTAQNIINMLQANMEYFNQSVQILIGKVEDPKHLQASSKEAFINMANLSDNFQKMLSEPKRKQYHSIQLHQFTNTSHMLTSYIASLSYYAQTLGSHLKDEENLFSVYQDLIKNNFVRCIMCMQNNIPEDASPKLLSLPDNLYLNLLIKESKEKLKLGWTKFHTEQEDKISTLQMIQSLFDVIFKTTRDQFYILDKYMQEDNKHLAE